MKHSCCSCCVPAYLGPTHVYARVTVTYRKRLTYTCRRASKLVGPTDVDVIGVIPNAFTVLARIKFVGLHRLL